MALPLAGLAAYLVFCLLVGLCGSQRRMGFTGTFLLALVTTPLVALIVLLITGPSRRAEMARRAELARQTELLRRARSVLPPGDYDYLTEINLAAEALVRTLSRSLEAGAAIFIDYGFPAREYYHPQRSMGTLRCHYRHRFHGDPFFLPGLQDITAHVNFTALADAVEEGGMQVQPLVTQSQFLLGIGEQNQFSDSFEECRLPQERAKVALQLKHLVTPAGMGESFHVLVASKDIGREQVSKLSGLTFGKATFL